MLLLKLTQLLTALLALLALVGGGYVVHRKLLLPYQRKRLAARRYLALFDVDSMNCYVCRQPVTHADLFDPEKKRWFHEGCAKQLVP